mmetsp:Transcript_38844/g.39232  ORF Transcript_38844/g.39232 Transcript_38844/m.39232 type:complete len:270 (-) Transcript_38844:390-1199(-)
MMNTIDTTNNAVDPKLAEPAVTSSHPSKAQRGRRASMRGSITRALTMKFTENEDDSVIAGSFRNLKDSVKVQRKRGTVNDGEIHAAGSSSEGLKRTIGGAIGDGVVDEGTVVPDADAIPVSSCIRNVKGLKAAVKALIFLRRLSDNVPQQPIEKNISFVSVKVRDYEMTLGDQICKKGAPVSLGWEYTEYPAILVDVYETNRPARRSVKQLEIGPKKRWNYLLDTCGVSIEELKTAQREVITVRRRRAVEKEKALNPGGPPDVGCCTVS